MPDKSWRKRIHSRPSRDSSLLQTTPSSILATGDSADQHRPLGWRRTIQGSRPQTPSSISPLTAATEDADDGRSEPSEVQTPRRNSKPKLARYTSLFSSFKEVSKGPVFSEPWNEDDPLPFQPYIDPLHALQLVHSHMMTFSGPIPLEHNSGLFRVFEDYRKVRAEKEHLENLLQDTLATWTKANMEWTASELKYNEEIRRLELLIAKSSSGMAGLFKARQGSVIGRKRDHQKTNSYSTPRPTHNFVSKDQIDNEIKTRSQQVLLHRPVSPSVKMAALSSYLTSNHEDRFLGQTLSEYDEPGLGRKAQSEANLSHMMREDDMYSLTDPTMSTLHVQSDRRPREHTVLSPEVMEPGLELDSLIALRELGSLVARKRGINVERFVDGVMELLSATTNGVGAFSDEQSPQPNSPFERNLEQMQGYNHGPPLTSRYHSRRFQSQPLLSKEQKRRHHFSFKIGDDQLQELEDELDAYAQDELDAAYSEDELSPLEQKGCFPPRSQSVLSTSPSPAWSAELQKRSKVPSAVGTLGRSRREESTSSVQTVFVRPTHGRRDSSSSVRTAFREQSRHSGKTTSIHDSSSVCGLKEVEPASIRKEDPDEGWDAEEAVASDRQTPPRRGSFVKSSTTSLSSAALLFGRLQSEEDELASP